MRSAILTLIFTITEHSLLMRGKCEGCKALDLVAKTKPIGSISYTLESRFRMECINDYVRKAGTSNLFRCMFDNATAKYSWRNEPPLVCIPDPSKRDTTTVAHTPSHMSAQPHIAPSTTPAVEMFHTAMETRPRQTPSTPPGKIGFTTTHTVATATETSLYSTVRTPAKDEEPLTTTNTTVLSSPSILTDGKYLTTKFPETMFSGNISSTTAGVSGIAAGVVLILITGIAAIVALLLWLRWCRVPSVQTIEMTVQSTEPNYPLLTPPSVPSNSSQERPIHSDSSQGPLTNENCWAPEQCP